MLRARKSPSKSKTQGPESADESKHSGRYLRSFLRATDESTAHHHEDKTETDEDKPQTLLVSEDSGKKYRSLKTRTTSTVVLIVGFILVVWAGHLPLLLLVLVLQALMMREAFGLGRMVQEERRLPGFRAQQWYFFFVATFYLYLRFISTNLLLEITSTKAAAKLLSWAVMRHQLISYFLYCAGFLMFVLSLKKGMYRYQFAQYAWTHMLILLVIMPTSFLVSNAFEGIIWFVMPAMLIVINDIFAYLSGFFFGRTPLIRLSPKKTWEGFIGAFICTIFFAFFASRIMAQFTWMTCPRKDLSLGALRCTPSPIFQDRVFNVQGVAELLPGPLEELLSVIKSLLPKAKLDALESWTFTAMPLQLHVCVMSVFASLIAPFGGFFASGFKRAFKLKDFGDTIPGHGGITDRFDCQVLMAMFSYLYYWNYIHVDEAPSMGEVLDEVLRLSSAQQLDLFARLGNLLAGRGLLPDELADGVAALMSASSTSL